jgi:hypothetical protein
MSTPNEVDQVKSAATHGGVGAFRRLVLRNQSFLERLAAVDSGPAAMLSPHPFR